MQKTIVIDFPEKDISVALCPSCNKVTENNLQYTDYVTHPMIWCNSGGCCAYYLINGSITYGNLAHMKIVNWFRNYRMNLNHI